MTYHPLSAGDIRQRGDEYRQDTGEIAAYSKFSPNPIWTNWQRVNLLGHPILHSDLMYVQFRRPC